MRKHYMILPDIHSPYDDHKALGLAEKTFVDGKFDGLICLGDAVDFYCISQHDKDPARKNDLQWEVDEGRRMFRRWEKLIAKVCPGQRIKYTLGNHEYRLERFINDKAPQMFRMHKYETLMGLDKTKWEVIPYRKTLRVGKLNITHDAKYAGSDAHKRTRAKYGGNIVIGHTHRMSIDYLGNLQRKSHVGAMFGWLGNYREIDYDHEVSAAEWVLGFGTGWHDDRTDIVRLHCHPIIGYEVEVDGQFYKGA